MLWTIGTFVFTFVSTFVSAASGAGEAMSDHLRAQIQEWDADIK